MQVEARAPSYPSVLKRAFNPKIAYICIWTKSNRLALSRKQIITHMAITYIDCSSPAPKYQLCILVTFCQFYQHYFWFGPLATYLLSYLLSYLPCFSRSHEDINPCSCGSRCPGTGNDMHMVQFM